MRIQYIGIMSGMIFPYFLLRASKFAAALGLAEKNIETIILFRSVWGLPYVEFLTWRAA